MGLRSNEIAGVLVRNGAKPENSDAAWAWLQENAASVKDKSPSLAFQLDALDGIAPMQCGEEEAVRELFEPLLKDVAGGERSLKKVQESMSQCRELNGRVAKGIRSCAQATRKPIGRSAGPTDSSTSPLRPNSTYPREATKLHTTRLSLFAEPLLPVCFVVGKVPLEPFDMRIALKGEDMRRNSVEKPAVVTNNNRDTAESLNRLLERSKRVDIEVVGRLIENQDICTRLHQLRHVNSVALTTGESPTFICWFSPLKLNQEQ